MQAVEVKIQDLKVSAGLAYMLWIAEGGEQHKHQPASWYFPRKKLTILKGNWRPWEVRTQAADLVYDHKLCVWHDSEGWHAGSYGPTDILSVFADADTMEMAICRATVAKYFGEVVSVPKDVMGDDL